MRVAGDRIDHRSASFDPVRKWVITQDRTSHGEIFRRKNQCCRGPFQECRRRFLLGGAKRLVKFGSDSRLLAIKSAANDVSMIYWNKPMLGDEAFRFADFVREKRCDIGPVTFTAANVSRTINNIDRAREVACDRWTSISPVTSMVARLFSGG